jgi:hypothetical protein
MDQSNFVVGSDRIYLNTSLGESLPDPDPSGTTMERMLEREFAPQWGWALRKGYWPHARTYDFVGQPGSVPSEWVARVIVFGKEPSTVINFDLGSLDLDSLVWGWVLDHRGRPMFDTRRGPKASFNLVFPDKLTWFSWPGDAQRAAKIRRQLEAEHSAAAAEREAREQERCSSRSYDEAIQHALFVSTIWIPS